MWVKKGSIMKLKVVLTGSDTDQVLCEKCFEWATVPREGDQLAFNGVCFYVTHPPCHDFDEGYVLVQVVIESSDHDLRFLTEESGWIVYPK